MTKAQIPKRTQVDQVSDWRRAGRKIPRLKCENPARRKRLEGSTHKWLRWYLVDAYPLPFGMVHDAMIDEGEKTLNEGGKQVTIAPRGSAKSTVFWGCCLKWILTGECPFPAYLPWAVKDKKQALRFWKTALCHNPRLLADYPEFCQPFAASKGSSQKCKTLLWDDTEEPTGAELLVSEGIIVMPDSLGVIGSSTINGNPRGMNHTTDAGRVWRPTAALIDDAQSKDAAKSASQPGDILDMIDTDIAGMAGPTSRMPMFLLSTVQRVGDVVDQLSKRRDWRCVKIGQILTWPKRMDLWDAFGELIKDNRETEARKLYGANKAAMQDGFTVSWPHRYDKKRKEPDALYSAMRDFYFLGKTAFMAERQGEPQESESAQYSLTVETVCSRVLALPRLHLPERTTVFVGHCDINRSKGGLHYCLAGFDQAMTGHSPAYGHYPDRGDLWPENASEQMIQQAIYAGLKAVCDRIAGTAFVLRGQSTQPSALWIDASFQSDVVHRFAAWANSSRLYRFKVVPAIGRAAHKYYFRRDSLIGRPFEGGHLQHAQADRSKVYAMFDADRWRETMQRAFLAETGSAGGFTLYAPSSPNEHAAFAAQVCAERIFNKYETPQGTRWEWRHAPGSQWDWGDALEGCWVAAASCGLSASGQVVNTALQRPKACVVIRKKGGGIIRAGG